jgi:hypothetical protein
LELQRSAGNAAVARLMTVGGDPLTRQRITRQSAYKRRLNTVISATARDAGLTPDAVRRELVVMTIEDLTFSTMQQAVDAAIGRRLRSLVTGALKDLKGAELSQETILANLETAFGGKANLHTATRHPVFADALLESIRTKQSTSWQKATEIHPVKKSTWTNDEMQDWTARHYTSKFLVVLGPKVREGIFEVADVLPPPFTELLSSATLATMDRPTGGSSTAYKPGDKMLMTYSTGASSSGHTTGNDWKNIGNVGDTFFGLFYKDEPATGKTPNFIRDAVYYAKWPITDFGDAWASSDWLTTADKSQVEDAPTPRGTARKGTLPDIIADIFPEAATRALPGGKEGKADAKKRTDAFAFMENFEVKKHGGIGINAWYPVPESIEKIKNWRVDAAKNKFIKLRQLFDK